MRFVPRFGYIIRRAGLRSLRMSSTTDAMAAADSPIVLDGTSAAGADGSATVLSADGQPISKSALKKMQKLKEIEAKKVSAAAAAEARAATAKSTTEDSSAAKKVSNAAVSHLLSMPYGHVRAG